MFTVEQIAGLEWQQIVPQQTPKNEYRVEITWALDKYRITVIKISLDCRMQVKHARHARTAVATANRFLRAYAKREVTKTVTFAERVNPAQFNFSPKMVAIVGAIIGHDYGVRDGRGNFLASISITSDGFIIGSCNSFLGAADDLNRNLADYRTFLTKEDAAQFDALYQSRVKDWRL